MIEFVFYPLLVIAVVGLCVAAFKYPRPFDRAVLPGIVAAVFGGIVWEVALVGYVLGVQDSVGPAVAAARLSEMATISWMLHPGYAYVPFLVVVMLLNTLPLIRNHLLDDTRSKANGDGK